jgi:pullulanase
VGDSWNQILVYYNGSTSPAVVQLPPGSWNLVVNNQQAGTLPIASGLSGTLPLAPLSADVLYE